MQTSLYPVSATRDILSNKDYEWTTVALQTAKQPEACWENEKGMA
jgi:hypothetical protein